jgi:hypothetical protein
MASAVWAYLVGPGYTGEHRIWSNGIWHEEMSPGVIQVVMLRVDLCGLQMRASLIGRSWTGGSRRP